MIVRNPDSLELPNKKIFVGIWTPSIMFSDKVKIMERMIDSYSKVKKEQWLTIFEDLVLSQGSYPLLKGTIIDVQKQSLVVQERNPWWQHRYLGLRKQLSYKHQDDEFF